MPGDNDERRPRHEAPPNVTTNNHNSTANLLAEVDQLTESLRGYLVVQVVIDDDDHRRTYLYRSAGAAERCVRRAKDRGRTAHVSVCQLVPVGVVVGLGGGLR